MKTYPNPIPKPPVLARGIDRDGNAAMAMRRDGRGVEAAAADCTKLHGPARAMCYQAQAIVAPPLSMANPWGIANPPLSMASPAGIANPLLSTF
jgi:hypothetical protein